VTICGGKWTTYRRMAEDCVNQAATLAQLPDRPCVTHTLPIHGAQPGALCVYGSDAAGVLALNRPERLHPDLPYTEAQVIWGVRQEMARTLDDMLSRRTRALVLNARAAVTMAPRVAALMAAELGRDQRWIDDQIGTFREMSQAYLPG